MQVFPPEEFVKLNQALGHGIKIFTGKPPVQVIIIALLYWFAKFLCWVPLICFAAWCVDVELKQLTLRLRRYEKKARVNWADEVLANAVHSVQHR